MVAVLDSHFFLNLGFDDVHSAFEIKCPFLHTVYHVNIAHIK